MLIIKPENKENGNNAKAQYLSISRYIVGKSSGLRRDSTYDVIMDDNRKNSALFLKQKRGIN